MLVKLLTALLLASLIPLTALPGISFSHAAVNASLIKPALNLVRISFPEIWVAIHNSTPTIARANPAEIGEALSGFPTYVIKWYRGGVSVKVTESVINGAPTPIRIEVMVNGDASTSAASIVKHGSKVLTEMRELYNALLEEALKSRGVKVIGFQIMINNTPVGFIDTSKPSVIPAQLLWNEYFVSPVLTFTVIDDYPIVKAALNNALSHGAKLKFIVGSDQLKNILSRHVNLSKVTDVMKYYVIANESARPAYLITLGPWNNAVVLADNGEYLPKPTPTATESVTHSLTSKSLAKAKELSGSWSFPVPRKYFPYFLSAVSMAVTAVIGWLIIRGRLRGGTRGTLS